MDPLSLTPAIVSSFKVTRSFDTAPLSSLSFDDTGNLCVTSAQDDSINVYDCRQGTLRTTLFSKRYGIGLTRFTHHSNNIVYGSTKEDGTLRYLSLYDNKYIRNFTGHKDRVVSLSMSPLDDKLISSSLDGTVRLWDLRSPYCEGMIQSAQQPITTIDNTGLVFGVGLNSQVLRLYDIRSFDTGPFATWSIPETDLVKGTYDWTSLKFTNDGQHVIVSTSVGVHYVIHAFEGHTVKRLVGPDDAGGEAVSVTPDARYVWSGGSQSVCVWDLVSHGDAPIAEFPTRGINVLGFNPALMMMVSGGNALDFWEPTILQD